MSDPDATTTFDFRSNSRAPVQIESQLLDWQSRASRLLSQNWQSLSGLKPDWQFPSPKIEDCRKSQLPQFSVVFELHLDGHAAPTLLVIPGVFGIALVRSTLGEAIEKMDDQRHVTIIETAMVEMFAAETVDAISSGGSGAGFPGCTLGSYIDSPDLVRIFPNETKLITLQFESEFPFGSGELQWIWPESLADDLFFDGVDSTPDEAHHVEDLRNLAMRMRINLRVVLGTVTLDIAELSKLKNGDILTLNQSINEPLSVNLANEPIMRAWPTRTGSHQSIQISECSGPVHAEDK